MRPLRLPVTLAWIGILLASLWLAGCQPAPSPFKGTDIRHENFGRRLELTDHTGQRRSLADFRGQVVVLFFGYTHCPDVCPTTLSDVAMAMRLLPPEQAKRVRALFVSVDERDTPETLAQYVPYFHPDFLGLYGTPEEIAAAAKEFRIVYRKHFEPGASDYLIDHTAGSYVIDAQGRLRLFLPFAQPPEDIAHDLALLLAEIGS